MAAPALPTSRHPGFTLVELLAVIAIMAILAAAIVPAVHSTSKSAALGMAAQMVVDEIQFCRSLAVGLNRPVEICFLRDTGSEARWFGQFSSRSLEQDSTRRWISAIRRLPDAVAISAHRNLSNVLGEQEVEPQGSGREGVALRFSPSGEVALVDDGATLSEDTRFLTLAYKTDLERQPGALPTNFATIQISPRNSNAVVHRP